MADAMQSSDKSSGCVNELQLHLEVLGEGLADQLRFPLPQEPVIDEQAGQTIPDGAVGQHRGHRRVHASAERSEEHTSELQSQSNLVCRLLLEKKKKQN